VLLVDPREAIGHHRDLWSSPSTETADRYVASFMAHRFPRPDCRNVADIEVDQIVALAPGFGVGCGILTLRPA
jgi:hypothetical protein